MNHNQVVYLDITSFSGVSIGAEHYYGKLVCSGDEYKTIELEKKLTSRQAKELNKKDGYGSVFRADSLTGRFDTEQEIISLAIVEYKKHFPEAKILLLGDSASAEAKKVLDAPSKELQEKCNALFNEQKKIGWINRGGFFYRTEEGEEKAWDLYKQWNRLISEKAE